MSMGSFRVGPIINGHRRLILSGIFVVTFIVFFAARATFDGWVRDDFDNIVWFQGTSPFQPLFAYAWGDEKFFPAIFDASFRNLVARQLSQLIRLMGAGYLTSPGAIPELWFAGVAGLIGATASGIFLVARHFTKSGGAALFATAIYILSAPFVQASWVVFAAIPTLVPLLICLGLLFYWQMREGSPRYRPLFAVLLGVVLFLGPLVREFLGIMPLLLGFQELFVYRKYRSKTLILAALAFLHACFPGVIVSLVLSYPVNWQSVFGWGLVGGRVDAVMSNVRSEGLMGLYHSLGLYLGSLYMALAPLLNVVVGVATAFAWVGAWREHFSGRRAGRAYLVLKRFLPPAHAAVFLVAVSGYAAWKWNFDGGPMTLLSLGLIVYAFMRSPFLAVWFAASYLPFLYFFMMQTHLIYPLVPGVIIYALAVEDLFSRLSAVASAGTRLSRPARLGRAAVVAAAAVAILDGMLNFHGSIRVVHGLEEGYRRVGQYLRETVEEGSIIVYNAAHGMEIQVASGGHFQPYLLGFHGRNGDPAALSELLADTPPDKPIYFLDMDQPYCPPGKYWGHGHRWLDYGLVPVEKVADIHVTRIRYPYADPLILMMNCAYHPFLGAPDSLNDFYRGRSLDGTPFLREVRGEYKLYKVTAREMTLWEPRGEWRLVLQDYRGFSIWENNGRYFGRFYKDETYDPSQDYQVGFVDVYFLTRMYEPMIVANDLSEAKALIDRYWEERRGT